MLFVENIIKDVVLPATNRLFNKRTEQPEKPKKNLNVFLNSAINDLVKNRTAQASEAPEPRMFDDDLVVRARTSGQEERKYDVDKILKAIAYNETRGVKGDKYAYSRDSGKPELGKARGLYQVTDGELKVLGQEIFGRKITSEEFQNSPELQDEYMKIKVQDWIDEGLTLEEIAALHNKGFSNYRDEGVKEKRVKEASDYVAGVVNYYNSL